MSGEKWQSLLSEKAELAAKLGASPFVGSVEIKTVGDERYIYMRRRELGKNRSFYIGKYSEELYALAVTGAIEARGLKKRIREIERALGAAGVSFDELPPRVAENMHFARANVKNLIYDQAVLEGVCTTFPETETILENGEVHGVRARDVQKILALKRAWEFILDRDVLSSRTDFSLLSHIARLVNEGFFTDGGEVRRVPVRIGGSSYVPPLPEEREVKSAVDALGAAAPSKDAAIDLLLFVMRRQIFLDGNKRAAVIFANHFMIRHGLGLIAVPEKSVGVFKKMLVAYYESGDDAKIRKFLREECVITF